MDASGYAYVTGASSTDFPTTPGAFQKTCGGGCRAGTYDAFVTKLNATGSALVYSTYLGGSSQDGGYGIALDASGNAYVTGYTESTDFPTTPGAFQTSCAGSVCFDAFVTKLNPTGSAPVYSTYLGGSSQGFGVVADASGNASITGYTQLPGFPTTPGAFQTGYGGGNSDAFVAKLNPTGSALVYSTFLGGTGDDFGQAIAVDSSANIYVTGGTRSPDFPATPGAFQTACGGRNCSAGNAFVTKLNSAGSSLVYSTYLGGSAGGWGYGMIVDASGNTYVTGLTTSPDFPITSDAFQTACGGGNCPAGDAFVTEFNPTGSGLIYSTYLGGSRPEFGYGMAVDGSGDAYVTGVTYSSDFPTTPGAFDTKCGTDGICNGLTDAFVAKFGRGVSLLPSTVGFGDQNVWTTGLQTVTLTNIRDASLNITAIGITGTNSGDFAQTNDCDSSVNPGASCTILVSFTPTASGSRTGVLIVTDNAGTGAQEAILAGTGIAPAPSVSEPLAPTSAVPGGTGFTLTVNGDGFDYTSVVNWNGSPRSTTFVSRTRLQATILASDIATAGAAMVTVLNPGPGGGTSNVAYFTITSPTASLALSGTVRATGSLPQSVIVADFNSDGKLDLASANSGSDTVSVFLGNGDGTFQTRRDLAAGTKPRSVVAGDFNGDGKLDLAVSNGGANTISILLGNGDGTFGTHTDFATGTQPTVLVAGDFNGDGKLDVAVANFKSNNVSVLLGNGDGTFQAHVDYGAGLGAGSLVAGDFNGDGKPDLACANFKANTVSILLGNGDGTFGSHVDYATGLGPSAVTTADFNGDGKLDLAVTNVNAASVSILAGKGDGTFQAHADYATGAGPFDVAAADLNGDSRLDLAVPNSTANTLSTLLGNGNGTFQRAVAVGDFNGDGRLDVAVANTADSTLSILLQIPAATLSATSLAFGKQNLGTTSQPRTVIFSNSGSAPMTITGIAITGTNPGDFAQTNTCGAGLIAGASCSASVTFAPKAVGTRSATLSIADNAPGSPQTVALSGTGVAVPIVSLSPIVLTFPTQVVRTTSKVKTVKVTNTGASILNISGISTTGDFAQTNSCGKALAAGGSCTINVTFKPTGKGKRAGSVLVTDNAAGSPQQVTLAGQARS